MLLWLPFATESGQETSLSDALFTATSAVCVTGLVVVDTGSHWSTFGELVILGLIQIGGFGIMAVTSLLALAFSGRLGLRTRMRAGTEVGVTEPQATFSACFGAPFMPRHPGVYAEMLGERIRVPVDMVVLCTAIQARHDAVDLGRVFGVNQGADGFFLEEHPKLGPLNTATDGVFLAGACQGPKDIPDTVAQASGAAAKALSLATRGEVAVPSAISWIDPEVCSGCQTCIDLCALTMQTVEQYFRTEPHPCSGKNINTAIMD